MGNRKDIGKAFREKLKDFDKAPGDNVWASIEADLQNKKKRRILPFWLIFTVLGVSLLGGILVWNQADVGNVEPQNPSVKQNQSPNGITNSNDTEANGDNTNSKDDGQTNANRNEADRNADVQSTQNRDNDSRIGNVSLENDPDGVASSGKNNTKTTTPTGRNIRTNETSAPNGLGNGKKASKSKSVTKGNPIPHGETQIASRKDSKRRNAKKSKNNTAKKWAANHEKSNPNGIAAASPFEIPNTVTGVAQTSDSKPSNVGKTDDKGVTDTPTESTEKETKTDSLQTASKTDKKTAAKEVLEKAKKEAQKLSLFVYGSPTYVAFTGKVSPYDRQLNANPVVSKIALSYGAYVIYDATDKWSLRFGLGLINQKTITQDATVNTLAYTGINYTKNTNIDIYAQSGATKMDLIQEISYVEVPLELKYAIVNGKFGVNAFGGLSLRFLGKNEISAETSNGMRFDVGETKYLSSNTFTITAGIGFDYKFARRIRFNVEPIFKYHLNDYKNVGVRPYSIGVLTGLQFSLK